MLLVEKPERKEPSKCMNIRHGVRDLGVTLLDIGLLLVQYFLALSPFLSFGTLVYILCHCMLKACVLIFGFDLTRVYS